MEYAVQPRASLFSNASSLGLGVKTKERLLFGIDPMRGAFLESLQDDSVSSGGRFEIEAASYAVMILSIFSCVWLLFMFIHLYLRKQKSGKSRLPLMNGILVKNR